MRRSVGPPVYIFPPQPKQFKSKLEEMVPISITSLLLTSPEIRLSRFGMPREVPLVLMLRSSPVRFLPSPHNVYC